MNHSLDYPKLAALHGGHHEAVAKREAAERSIDRAQAKLRG